MIAFTFPGQGSQRPGMGRAWAEHPSWELVAEASEAAGRDLEALLLDADADELVSTRNAQLATFVASLVVLDAVERIGVEPARVAGHSLGEYSALVAAGAIAFDDGVRLVAERGAAMQVAAEDRSGTMAAVLGLDDDKVEIACARVDGEVWVANYNAPGQVVIAGDPAAIDAAGAAAKDLGAKRVMSIPVSGAFHTPFMAPARDRLRKAIASAEIRAPEVPVYANVDALPHLGDDEWDGLLAAQLLAPVRWKQTLLALEAEGVTKFVELGPGTVLTGMAKRTVSGARTLSVATPDDLDSLLEALHAAPDTDVGQHDGEHLFATERLVVSPAAGLFTPDPAIGAGTRITPGQLLGHVGEHEVRTPFAGAVQGWLAVDGERVTPSQPIAWLRTV
ncbi:MAG TPA: ACP S-malonyltransferase [Acidimicrobiales bacterium]|nr:ACP S-malonyltransferase [Acidimicrobiales bacterium]